METWKRNFGKSLALAVATLILTACPPKKKPILPVEVVPPPAEETAAPEPALEIAAADWVTAPQLQPVHFDTNRAELTPAARAALKANAPVVKAVLAEAPSVTVRVEGHCDERNTLEYNLALGQRRANAVRDYYVNLGVPKKILSTISYGEEKPVCRESAEDCWWRNRRGETTLKSSGEPVRIPLSKLPANP